MHVLYRGKKKKRQTSVQRSQGLQNKSIIQVNVTQRSRLQPMYEGLFLPPTGRTTAFPTYVQWQCSAAGGGHRGEEGQGFTPPYLRHDAMSFLQRRLALLGYFVCFSVTARSSCTGSLGGRSSVL